MNQSIPLKPTDDDIRWWIDHFVPEYVLWWWDDSAIPNESEALRILKRDGCRQDPVIGDIRYVNAFHTWAMHEDVQRVVVDDGSWVASLSDEGRQHARDMQVRYKRGLCIPHQRFGSDTSLPEHVIFEERVVLDQSLWTSMTEDSKRSVIETELADWDRDTTYPLPEGTTTHIADIANSFVLQEGVNCLAVVAYALTGTWDDLFQWMMPDAFDDILRSAGYVVAEASVAQNNDVIVFQDEEDSIVHAAYVIEPDRILNKSGQTSFNPIAIIDLTSLREDWKSYRLSIHRIP